MTKSNVYKRHQLESTDTSDISTVINNGSCEMTVPNNERNRTDVWGNSKIIVSGSIIFVGVKVAIINNKNIGFLISYKPINFTLKYQRAVLQSTSTKFVVGYYQLPAVQLYDAPGSMSVRVPLCNSCFQFINPIATSSVLSLTNCHYN